jgi:RNA polymerase sigma-70 factor (ECF subfamily)
LAARFNSNSMIKSDMAPQTTAFDEAGLVAQARHGDNGAFNDLTEHYQRNIFRLAQHITQNREDAEDVLQETFLKAYKHLPEFEGHSKFYTWIVRIAVNEALMKLRKRKWDKTVWLDEPVTVGEDVVAREIAVWEDNPEERYSKEEVQEILDKAVNGLAAPYRTVFVLRDMEGLSTEDTAKALDLSVPAVKSRLLRARLQLRDKLTGFFKKKVEDPFAYL